MMTKARLVGSVLCLIATMKTPVAAVDCCFIDDPSQQHCTVQPIQSNEELSGDVCGHTITGSNCLLQIKGDVTASTPIANCLTIGPGVTVDLEKHTFACTAALCGSAIAIAGSGGTLQKVAVKNGVFTGCWANGAIARLSTGGTNHTVENVTVDGAIIGSCVAQGDGIDGISTLTEVLVKNTANFGVRLNLSNAKIEHSIVRNNSTTGIESNGSTNQTINNVLVIDNNFGIQKTANTSATITTKGSVIRDSVSSNCVRFSVSDDTCSQSQFLNYTGDPTFVDDTIK